MRASPRAGSTRVSGTGLAAGRGHSIEASAPGKDDGAVKVQVPPNAASQVQRSCGARSPDEAIFFNRPAAA